VKHRGGSTLGIHYETVRTHVKNLLRKFGASSLRALLERLEDELG
jgi:DNA-binding CsgD family transcriptional regulator